MYNIIIADDEKTVRMGLKEFFQFCGMQINVCAEADNGASAWELIVENEPDVVLTDIKMPIMDGLELTQKIVSQYPEIKIVFISGYDDRDFLKQALKFEVVDYIFKPIDYKELETVIRKVLNIVDEEKNTKNKFLEMQGKIEKSMPILKEKFFMNIVRGGYQNRESLISQAEFLNIQIADNARYCVMIAEFDDMMLVFDNISECDRQCYSYGILNIFQELIDSYTSGFVFENNPCEYVAIIDLNDGAYSDRMYALADKLKKAVHSYINYDISIGIGESVTDIYDVCSSYEQARKALRYKLFLGKSNTVAIDGVMDTTNEFCSIDTSEIVEKAMMAENEDDVKQTVVNIFSDLRETRSTNKFYYQAMLIPMVLKAELMAENVGVEMGSINFIEDFCKLDTLESMEKLITERLLCIYREIKKFRYRKSTGAITALKQIIDKRYAEDLKINELADLVYLSPTYLCLLFKQETNLTISEYRNRVRIEKAKDMLKDIHNKIYDVSYAVGYENPSYFGLQFKKIVGVSPKEYRDSLTEVSL